MKAIPPENDSYDRYVRGLVLFEEGKAEEAIAVWCESFNAAPHFKTALRLAAALGLVGRHAERDAWIGRAFELHPEHNEVGTAYAELLIRERKVIQANQVLDRILAKSPSYGPARSLRDRTSPAA